MAMKIQKVHRIPDRLDKKQSSHNIVIETSSIPSKKRLLRMTNEKAKYI